MATNPWDAFPAVEQQAGPVYGAPDPAEGRAVQDQAMQIQNMGRVANNDAARLQMEQERLQMARDEQARKSTGRPLSDSTTKRIEGGVGQFSALNGSLGGFKDDYAGNPIGSLENTAQGLYSGIGTEGQRNWWANFRATDNVIRNELFGAALTPQEKSSYEATTIDPSLDPKIVRENLSKRTDILRGALERQKRFMIANGYNDEAVEILYEPLRALEQLKEADSSPPPINDEEGLQVNVTDDSPNVPPNVPPTGPGGGTPLGGTEGGLMDLAKQGVTLGLADEAAGVGGYLSGFLTGEDPQAAYTRERDAVRGRVADARERYPVLGTATEILAGGGAARVAAPVTNALSGVIKSGAALGAAGGFGYGEGAQGSVGGAAVGGALGGALGGITQGIGRGVNALAGRIGTAATPAQREVVQAGEREGVRVMTSDVRPPQSFTARAARGLGERIPFAGTGGPRAAQQAERVTAVQNVLNDFNAADAADAVGDVSADIIATRGAEIGRLSNQKNAVISGIQGAVPAPKAIAAIDQQIAKLSGVNEEAFAPVIQKLTQFRDALASGKTLEQVEGNRKLLGDLFADPSLAAIKGDGQKALNAVYGPLRQDMGDFIKQAGGRGQYSRWKNANDKLSAMAGELKSSAFKGLLNNAETTPEAAAKIIFNGTASDMQRVFNSLSPSGKVKAQSAILYKAAQGAAEGDNISPQKFATAMGKLNDATKTFFDPADKARLDGLERLLKSTQRASEAAALPPTGVQNSQLAGGFTLGTLFGTAALPVAGGLGLLARAYESAPVRNALLRLGRTTAGSGAESRATEAVRQALTRFAANDNRAAAMAASPGAAAADEPDGRREPVR